MPKLVGDEGENDLDFDSLEIFVLKFLPFTIYQTMIGKNQLSNILRIPQEELVESLSIVP